MRWGSPYIPTRVCSRVGTPLDEIFVQSLSRLAPYPFTVVLILLLTLMMVNVRCFTPRGIVLIVQLLPAVVQPCSYSYYGMINCSRTRDDASAPSKFENGSWIVQCPPWFAADDDSGRCKAGPTLDGMIDQDSSLLETCLMPCNCMTEENGALTIGFCLQACAALQYYSLPCDVHQLQNWSCQYLNRHGVLCSQCLEGFSLPVYSYTLECVRCESYKYNWLKYLVAAYLPLIFLYICVALFSINFASPNLNGAVIMFQIAGHPVILQLATSLTFSVPFLNVLVWGAFSFASLWNLDFFRLFYTFCLHPNASKKFIMALEFGKAVFPVMLIGITVALVKLHDKNCNVVVWPWKVAQRLRKFVRPNIKSSLIQVFASFVYLSSCRLFLTSIYFLIPSATYTYYKSPGGHMVLEKEYRLIFDSSVIYFDKGHIPYAILAMIMLTVFFIIPMLLQFVYPFSWFQRTLNRGGCNFVALHIFMDVFQGSYKDGTNGTNDYRFFSGLTMLVPVTVDLAFVITKSVFIFPVASIVILLCFSLHLIFQPFKRSGHNRIMALMLFALLGTVISMKTMGYSYIYVSFNIFMSIVFLVMFSIPFLYVILLPCVTCWKYY